MLTGAWGIGKSYYIKNSLVPFLSESKDSKHQCIVVSLYGLSSLAEISKTIYLEVRAKKLKAESESGKVAALVAKTVLRGLAGSVGLDLNADEKDFQAIYESINLAGKLIVFEDVERAGIGILEILGYVNSLVEQDDVKVLLVTNEAEIIKYRPAEKKETENKTGRWSAGAEISKVPCETNEYTEETQRYLETKEKSVGDTITFTGDLEAAVKEIIKSFDNKALLQFATEQTVEDITEIMYLTRNANLRSVIFACQKTSDIFEIIDNNGNYSEDFQRTVFYGIVAFSLRLHAGTKVKWDGMDSFSSELGIGQYPLFQFCFDYITTQQFDIASIPAAAKSLDRLRLYDRNKTNADSDLQALCGYHIHYEVEVKNAVANITRRLSNPEDISFYDYGRIAASLVSVKHALDIEIDTATALLISNLKGRGNYIREDDLFLYALGWETEEERDEYNKIRKEMICALNDVKDIIPEFTYLPEQVPSLYEYTVKHSGYYFEARGFAKFLNIPRFVEMFFRCTPAQMNRARATFVSLYRSDEIKDYFADDLLSIKELLAAVESSAQQADIDSVQKMQCQWFINNLTEIANKLS